MDRNMMWDFERLVGFALFYLERCSDGLWASLPRMYYQFQLWNLWILNGFDCGYLGLAALMICLR